MTSVSPGSSRLITTVDALRTALAESPDVPSFTLGETIDEETTAEAEADGVPREFLDFCRVLDGASCGPSVQLFGLAEAEEHQFYCEPVVDAPPELSPKKLFCIGLVNQAAVFLDRTDGRVLGALEHGPDWIDAEHLEQVAPDLEAYFLERLATFDEYVRLVLVDDELLEYDDWLKLLRRAGLAD